MDRLIRAGDGLALRADEKAFGRASSGLSEPTVQWKPSGMIGLTMASFNNGMPRHRTLTRDLPERVASIIHCDNSAFGK